MTKWRKKGYVDGKAARALPIREAGESIVADVVHGECKIALFRCSDGGYVSYVMESHKRKDLGPCSERFLINKHEVP
jgi:hypothetical protein